MGCDLDKVESDLDDGYIQDKYTAIQLETKDLNLQDSLTVIEALSNMTKNDLRLVDYSEVEKQRRDELLQNPKRVFAPPKLRSARLSYVTSKMLHETAFCSTFLGIELSTGTVVELHKLNLAQTNQNLLEAFLNSIEFRTNLRHQNLRRLFDIRTQNQEIQAVTELSGRPLAQLINDFHGLDEPFVRRIAYAVLEFISYANECGVTMNNISPYTITVRGGTPMISTMFPVLRYQQTSKKRGQLYYHCPEFFIQPGKGSNPQSQQAGMSLSSFRSSLRQTNNASPNVQRDQPLINRAHRSDIYQLGNLVFHAMTTKPIFFQYKETNNLLYTLNTIQRTHFAEYLQHTSPECRDFIDNCVNRTDEVRGIELLKHPWFKNNEDDCVDSLLKQNSDEEYRYKGLHQCQSCLESLGLKRAFRRITPKQKSTRQPRRMLYNAYEGQEHAEYFNMWWK